MDEPLLGLWEAGGGGDELCDRRGRGGEARVLGHMLAAEGP